MQDPGCSAGEWDQGLRVRGLLVRVVRIFLFLSFIFILSYVNLCAYVYVKCRCPRRPESDYPSVGIMGNCSLLMWGLGIEPGSSTRAEHSVTPPSHRSSLGLIAL